MEEVGSEDPDLRELQAERLRDRISVSVIRIAEAEAQKNGCTISGNVMAAVADLTYKFAEQLGHDLELFAQHAGRKSINVDDVILAAHRNEDVSSTLRSLSKDLMKSKDPIDKKRKKSVAKMELH